MRWMLVLVLLTSTASADLMKTSDGQIVNVSPDEATHARATGAVDVSPSEAGEITARRRETSDNTWTQVALGIAICGLGAVIWRRRRRAPVGRF